MRTDDSLWLIAAHRLQGKSDETASDAAVAAYWPQIYTANRAAIGDDPGLITPGRVLHLPAPDGEEFR